MNDESGEKTIMKTQYSGLSSGPAFLVLFLICSAFLVPRSAFSSDIPDAINYQGKLTDNLGNVVTSGYYEIQFRVWDHPTLAGAGNLIWGRSFPLHVMSDGIFNILLSNDGGAITNPVSPATNDIRQAFEGEDRYLGLTITRNPAGAVGSPTEISPRQCLVSAPYAIHAQNATLAQQATMALFASNAAHAVNADAASAGFNVTGNLAVSGSATANGGLVVHGPSALGGSLGVGGATVISNTLLVTGNLTVNSPATLAGYGTVPIGFIGMWSGASNNIPNGWALCDGGTYSGHATPDLRDRFVVGAGGSDYGVGSTGGTNSVTLSVGQMPKHSHTRREGKFQSWGGHGAYNNVWVDYSDSTYYTGDAGNDEAHENRPPYYALCYIMRVK
jgi:microcystin-dependent protein